ncbi:MAG: crossover junction endodeoxyribonuclease RuvC [Nitrospirae bacterium]|nr:crossover junction endodeoxyribonuclease RuvC [Nitrospirota bacterium]
MRVLGIDPGTICCGYGVVESGVRGQGSELNSKLKTQNSKLNSEPIYIASGEIKLNKADTLPERLKSLYDSLKTVIAEHKPSHMCIEKIFYHKSIRSAFALGAARGIVMLLSAETAIPIFEHNSTELKQAITGYGRAEKHQVEDMIKRILNINSKLSPDAADALALCVCHINSSQLTVDNSQPKEKMQATVRRLH